MAGNNAPKTFWHRVPQACGTIRHMLWVDERQTPFFIDEARTVGHRSYGSKIGLWASGTGGRVRCRDGSEYRIAGFIGGYDKITLAKHRAEQMALAE